MNVLIIGVGTVGSNLEKELAVLRPHLYDKYKGIDTRQKELRYDAAFVCVDAPMTEESDCDISEVLNAVTENDADVFVIKSTVLPGTTERLADETGKKSSSVRSITELLSTATTSASGSRYSAGTEKIV